MSSIMSQFPKIKSHNALYPEIDPKANLKNSAAGKVILITGASQGIGQTTSVAFAQAGAKAIFLLARSADALKKTQQLVLEANPQTKCAFKTCDVTDEGQVQAAVEDCIRLFGAIDVVDSNAGSIEPWVKIGESNTADWRKTWETTIYGSYLVLRYTMKHLATSAQKHSAIGLSGGHLILVSSVGGQVLLPGASAYGTAKHAINRLAEFVNSDHRDQGVKCFAIHPGGVKTDLATKMPKEFHSGLVDEPELPAGFAVWLASGCADWASGRYLSANWDVTELDKLKDQILENDLMVNRLIVTK